MDDLRWILLGIGVVLVAAIYFSGRFEREEWRRDREGFSGFSNPERKPDIKTEYKESVHRERETPQIKTPDKKGSIVAAELKTDVKENIGKQTTKRSVAEEIKKEEKFIPAPEAEKQNQPPEIIPKRHQSVGIRSEDDVKKALGMGKPNQEDLVSQKEEIPEEKMVEVDWEGVIESAKDPLVEDEIIEVDIPEEITELDKGAEEETELKFKPGIEEPLQQELLLEIDPLVLVLTVMAKGDDYLEGKSIRRVLDGSGLKCDERGIYQFHMTGKKDAVFSVVSVIEPGIFDMETINEYETPGLSFFCQLPGPLANKDMFRIMQMKALNIAEKLGGQLCDDKRNLLTEQSTAHYFSRIAEFDVEMVLASKKQQ